VAGPLTAQPQVGEGEVILAVPAQLYRAFAGGDRAVDLPAAVEARREVVVRLAGEARIARLDRPGQGGEPRGGLRRRAGARGGRGRGSPGSRWAGTPPGRSR